MEVSYSIQFHILYSLKEILRNFPEKICELEKTNPELKDIIKEEKRDHKELDKDSKRTKVFLRAHELTNLEENFSR